MPVPLKLVIFRILQEALNNAVKHGKGDLIVVSLQENGDGIHLRIEDNGIGFDPDQRRSTERDYPGIGLVSMKERAELSGGTFKVASERGKGTAIQVSFPVPPR